MWTGARDPPVHRHKGRLAGRTPSEELRLRGTRRTNGLVAVLAAEGGTPIEPRPSADVELDIAAADRACHRRCTRVIMLGIASFELLIVIPSTARALTGHG
jgi:hypothetical protein